MLIASGASKGYICIEDNKMDVYETFRQTLSGDTDIQVALFKEKYPQGAEKQLVSALLNKEVPYGGLPIDIGVIVNNVGTAKALCDAVELGKPLTHHYLTITGNIENPSNFYVPVGILFKELINEDDLNKNKVLLAGGLMMGKAMYTEETPVTKGINAVILLDDLPKVGPELQCVRCSSCIDNCPAFLSPTTLAQLVKNNKYDALNEYGIVACIECGTCSYVCPSHIPLLDYIRHGKLELRRR
jgi:Na+-translocating ferredoxin:NAD+ oxidoreductase subunit C